MKRIRIRMHIIIEHKDEEFLSAFVEVILKYIVEDFMRMINVIISRPNIGIMD